MKFKNFLVVFCFLTSFSFADEISLPKKDVLSIKDIVSKSASCHFSSDKTVDCDDRLVLSNLKNKDIRGEGVEIRFRKTEVAKAGFVVNGADNVDISNLSISWVGGGVSDALPEGVMPIQSFASVSQCTNGGRLVFDRKLNGLFPVRFVSIWDKEQGWPWYESGFSRAETSFPNSNTWQIENGVSECNTQLKNFVGQMVLVRHVTSNSAFRCSSCNHVKVENVRIYSAPGMGFVFQKGGQFITLRNNVVAPRCFPNCKNPEPSIVGDASHFQGVTGDILIENNDFGWQGDDSVNITGLLMAGNVKSSDGKGVVVQIDDKLKGRLAMMKLGKAQVFACDLSLLGEVDILSSNVNDGSVVLSAGPANSDRVVFSAVSQITKNVIIRNNYFHDHRARGVLVNADNAVIENNRIEHLTMAAILSVSDAAFWFEGPRSDNLLIRGNKIRDVNRFPNREAPYAIGVTRLIEKSCSPVSQGRYDNLVIEDNVLQNIKRNSSLPIGVLGGFAIHE